MKKLILSMVLALLAGMGMGQTDFQLFKVNVGDKAPEFQVELTNGKTVNLADLKGKIVLLDFYTTSCGVCIKALARAQEDIIDRFAGKDVVFLPISCGEDKAKIKEFVEKRGYKWASGVDPEGKIKSQYSDWGVPQYLVIGADGKLMFAEIGSQGLYKALEIIEKTLEKKENLQHESR